jgi:hypothetical protein
MCGVTTLNDAKGTVFLGHWIPLLVAHEDSGALRKQFMKLIVREVLIPVLTMHSVKVLDGHGVGGHCAKEEVFFSHQLLYLELTVAA